MAATKDVKRGGHTRVARCVLSLFHALFTRSWAPRMALPGPTLPPALAQPHPDSLRSIT